MVSDNNNVIITQDASKCTSLTVGPSNISIDITPYLCLANEGSKVLIRNCDDDIITSLCLDVANSEVVYNGKCTVGTNKPLDLKFQNLYDVNLGTCIQTWDAPPNTITSTTCSGNTNEFAIVNNKLLVNDGKPYFDTNIDNRICVSYNTTDGYGKLIRARCSDSPVIGFRPKGGITLGNDLCIDNGGCKFCLAHAVKCDDNNANQIWTFDTAKIRGGKLHNNGQCLGLTGANQDCNGAPTWNWQADGKIKASNGQCLAIVNKSLTLDDCSKVGAWGNLCIGTVTCVQYSFLPLF